MKIEIRDNLIDTPEKAVEFAIRFAQRVPELESLILQDPIMSYKYAVSCVGERWLEGEPIIASNGLSAYHYATRLFNGPWEEGEEAIKKVPRWSVLYIKELLHMRWPAAEPYFQKVPSYFGDGDQYWKDYLSYLRYLNYPKEIKLQWLIIEGITDNLIEILNYLGSSRDIQEYIIQRRPDLINKLEGLRPEIEKKYAHELGLSGIEI
jgi:hypothetical protein